MCIVYKVKGRNFTSVSCAVFCPPTTYLKTFYTTFDINISINNFESECDMKEESHIFYRRMGPVFAEEI